MGIVQCMQGHKICEPCSEKEEVVACPECKLAFLGRDMGMEACVQNMTEGCPARVFFLNAPPPPEFVGRKKEDLIMEKIKIVAEELKADVQNVEVQLKEVITTREVKLRADFMEEMSKVQNALKAEIVKVKTPAAEFIPECPIC